MYRSVKTSFAIMKMCLNCKLSLIHPAITYMHVCDGPNGLMQQQNAGTVYICKLGSICEFPVYKFNVPLFTSMTLSRSFKTCLNYKRRQSSFLSFMWQRMRGKESLSWSQVGAGIIARSVGIASCTIKLHDMAELYAAAAVCICTSVP